MRMTIDPSSPLSLYIEQITVIHAPCILCKLYKIESVRMPVKKYYCDYCDKLFQDTPADRKRHVQGIQHHQAKARWYDSFKQQQIPPIPNRPLCFHFVNTGFCRYGDSCKYLHPVPNNNVQQPPIVTTPSPSPGSVVGVSFGNLPPSLQPPPDGVYLHLPFLDWG
ncbi:hypothetical protein GLYMA_10G144700v4 [Glycine max]|nr:hypothetical protein GLYMA_10G144700v4 [Glycine max]KAH1138222.1 hypothetical protein GYH30_027994 [Glycine max]RZB87250.1 Zinc finger CCCH domain-containing protein 3 isoform B [Glycine soja]